MTITAAPAFDVFISYTSLDRKFAVDVANRLRAEGLEPFYLADVPAGTEISGAIWDALAECHVFMVIISPDSAPDAMGMIELGAAAAWSKPIIVLLNGPASTRVPQALRDYAIYPRNRIDEVVTRIRRNLEPMTDDERQVLVDCYAVLGIPTDQLSQSPVHLRQLGDAFNEKTSRHLSATRLLSELLRLRKQSKLPRIQSQRRRAEP
ncbi:MAG: toll/interleukin-1 receptor domain-containing protein [Planctomyces sp.]|jgi:hypothetical protein|nr:toll/interleukin-1 receptor domain-containing protein [Planctomyces sp.]